MSPHSHTPSTAANYPRASVFVAGMIGLIYALTLLPPWIPTFLTGAEFRDPSWRYMLHEGFVQRLEFGRDIIFTYGPFGFFTTRMFHPQTFSLLLALWIGLSVLFFGLTWSMALRHCRSPWIALLLTAIAIRVVFVEAMIFLFSFIVILVAWRISSAVRSEIRENHRSVAERILFGLLLLTTGFLPLTKYTFVPAVFFVVAVIAVLDVCQRRIPWQSLTVMGSLVCTWGLSGQPMSGIIDYLSAGFEVAHRYTDAMTNWETEPFDIAMVVTAVAVIPFVTFCSRIRNRRQGWLNSATYPLVSFTLLFLVFKFTCVGFHAHKLPIYFGSAFLITLYLLLATNGRREFRRRSHLPVTFVTGLLCVFSLVSSYVRFIETDHSTPALAILGNPQHPAAMKSWLRGDSWMRQRHDANFDAIRKQHPLPDFRGTIDVVPDKLAMAIAADSSRFVPRPLLHTYATHSTWLAEQNAAHYRSTDGPDNVLFRLNPIVGRFPTMNDGRLWLELFRSFDVQEELRTDLLLCRRPTNRTLELKPISAGTFQWNEAVSLPESYPGLIWCRVKIERTSAGKLAAFAYKLPEIWMDVTDAVGESTTYRFTTASGASGFLLSPIMHQRESLAALLSQQGNDRLPAELEQSRVVRIRFRTSELARRQFHVATIGLEFFEVRMDCGDPQVAARVTRLVP